MRFKSTRQSVLLIVIITIGVGIALFPPVSRAVTVGPVKLEYTVDPGKTIEGNLFLQNSESSTKTFYPSFEKFTETNGQKNFTKEESDLSTWFKVTSAITLKPGEPKQVPFKIIVPKNAPPGGHFAVIWWSTSPPGGNSQQVSIVTRAGILVYITVSGDIKEEGALSDFSASHRIFSGFPLNFNFSFKNTGNSYLKPIGNITIKNVLGMNRVISDVNQYGSNILPQSDRSFSEQIKADKFMFGPYRAQLNLTYGTTPNEQKISANYWFLILPWDISIAVVVLLALIFFVIPRGIKKYNAWIVDKSRGR